MRGNSFLTILMFITVTGILITSIVKLSHRYLMIEKEELIESSLNVAYDSLLAFYSKNGYYPCPSPINVSRDNKKFGKAVMGCTVSSGGVDMISADGGMLIASGGLPVRTLGLPDNQAFDSSHKRFLYSISAGYTLENSETYPQQALIKLVDRTDNNATNEKVIFTLIGFANENEGAYSVDGELLEECGVDSYFSENCDKDDTFTHSALNIDFGNKTYASKIRYQSEAICRKTANVAERVGFILDTSTSMRDNFGVCPPGSKNAKCSRMEGALWGLHNALSARMIQAKTTAGLFTGFTGFTGKVNQNDVLTQLTDIEITSEQDIQDTIYQICYSPIGTPLGAHLWAMAEVIGDGKPDRPNIITIISDGANTKGVDPVVIATGLKIDKPNLLVNIIDVANTPSSKKIADLTGGQYYKVSQPDDLMKAIYKSMGSCFADELPEVSGEQKICKLPEPPPPPPPPEPRVKVSLVVKIIVPDPVYVSGYSREEVEQALQQALEAAEASVSQQLSDAISVAISEALDAFDNGESIPVTHAAIRQAFDDALDVAMSEAVDSANQKIDNMPAPLQAPIRDALVRGVSSVLSQFNGAIDPYIAGILDTGEMPPLVLTSVGSGAVVVEDPDPEIIYR